MSKKIEKFESFKRTLKKNKWIVWTVVIGASIDFGLIIGTSASDNPSLNRRNFPKTLITDEHKSYSIAYDLGTRNPAWVLEVFNRDSSPEMSSTKFTYNWPENLPQELYLIPEDYNYGGHQIGHLLASAISPYPILASSPQNTALASDFWINFNEYTRQIRKKRNVDNVLVITGPLYLPKNDSKVAFEVIGQKRISVPSHFFRAIFYPARAHISIWREISEKTNGFPYGAFLMKQNEMIVKEEIYLIPNEPIEKNTPLDSYRISFDEWKKISGIILPMQNIKFYLGDF